MYVYIFIVIPTPGEPWKGLDLQKRPYNHSSLPTSQSYLAPYVGLTLKLNYL